MTVWVVGIQQSNCWRLSVHMFRIQCNQERDETKLNTCIHANSITVLFECVMISNWHTFNFLMRPQSLPWMTRVGNGSTTFLLAAHKQRRLALHTVQLQHSSSARLLAMGLAISVVLRRWYNAALGWRRINRHHSPMVWEKAAAGQCCLALISSVTFGYAVYSLTANHSQKFATLLHKKLAMMECCNVEYQNYACNFDLHGGFSTECRQLTPPKRWHHLERQLARGVYTRT